MSQDVFQTEYPFTLPIGFVDASGTLHREGTMRLASAGDEILPMKDPRVQSNPAYLSVIVLARVITKLGSLSMINTHVIEKLFSRDFAYLQDLYNKINHNAEQSLNVTCPSCGHGFDAEAIPSGEV